MSLLDEKLKHRAKARLTEDVKCLIPIPRMDRLGSTEYIWIDRRDLFPGDNQNISLADFIKAARIAVIKAMEPYYFDDEVTAFMEAVDKQGVPKA